MSHDSIEEVAASFPLIRAQAERRVLDATINRPVAPNAPHGAAQCESDRAFVRFANAGRLRFAIVAGSGADAICAATDHKERLPLAASRDSYSSGSFVRLTHRFDLDKPVIATVNGRASAGGLAKAISRFKALGPSRRGASQPEQGADMRTENETSAGGGP